MVLCRPELQEHFLRARSWLNAFSNPLWFTKTNCSEFQVKTAVCWDWYTTMHDLGRFFSLWMALWIESLQREAFLQLQTGWSCMAAPQCGWFVLALPRDRIRSSFLHLGLFLCLIALGVANTPCDLALDGKRSLVEKVDLQRNFVYECMYVWFFCEQKALWAG